MTEPVDPEVLRDAGRLVHRLMADFEVEEWEQADFFVVECFDPETGRHTLHGRWMSPAPATAYADEWEQDLNRGMPEGEPKFRCRVKPVRPV